MRSSTKVWLIILGVLFVIGAINSLFSGRSESQYSPRPTESSQSGRPTESNSGQSDSPSASPAPSPSQPSPTATETVPQSPSPSDLPSTAAGPALEALEELEIKGRAPQTGYSREQFSDGWGEYFGCDLRNRVLARDLTNIKYRDDCIVESGLLDDPYSGRQIDFLRGVETSYLVQIDHVVAVSDAWQKGAQRLTASQRYSFYNDPLNLLAVSGSLNQQKGDSDAASWLPPNKSFRCKYVARQIAVKLKYQLWVTQAEYDAIRRVLGACPEQGLPQT